MLFKANEYQIAETQQNRSVRDFVNAVQYKFPYFASSYQFNIKKEHTLDMNTVMEHFHRHMKNQITHLQKESSYSAFQAST